MRFANEQLTPEEMERVFEYMQSHQFADQNIDYRGSSDDEDRQKIEEDDD